VGGVFLLICYTPGSGLSQVFSVKMSVLYKNRSSRDAAISLGERRATRPGKQYACYRDDRHAGNNGTLTTCIKACQCQAIFL
ncbi:hypothetical protein BGY98DRAFT_957131, partial [Russula aff. rugulosa BPL654]